MHEAIVKQKTKMNKRKRKFVKKEFPENGKWKKEISKKEIKKKTKKKKVNKRKGK